MKKKRSRENKIKCKDLKIVNKAFDFDFVCVCVFLFNFIGSLSRSAWSSFFISRDLYQFIFQKLKTHKCRIRCKCFIQFFSFFFYVVRCKMTNIKLCMCIEFITSERKNKIKTKLLLHRLHQCINIPYLILLCLHSINML